MTLEVDRHLFVIPGTAEDLTLLGSAQVHT
jgi:hypothetical protein